MSKIRVRKYGGSSLADPKQILSIARDLVQLLNQNYKLIVVVSAMGKSTDELHSLAKKISPIPDPRELDMLLSTGERVSMALMSMALHDLGVQSISFTGSQAGLMTDEAHTSARILEVKPLRVEEELKKNSIVVLAGFQGVSPKTKEITTLGRGGSDTTAVAVAAAFGAEACEILKDVDGIYSADPHKFSQAVHLPHLHYSHLLDMTFWGAKVLHYRSVELAALLNVEIEIKLAHPLKITTEDHLSDISKIEAPLGVTKINGETSMFEQGRIIAINSKTDVRKVRINRTEVGEAYEVLANCLEKSLLPWPQLLHCHTIMTKDSTLVCEFIWTSSTEAVAALVKVFANEKDFEMDPSEYCTISLTCQGLIGSNLSYKYLNIAKHDKINVCELFFGAMGMTFLINGCDHGRCLEAMQKELALQPNKITV